MAVAFVITGVWTTSFAVGVMSPTYSPPVALTPLMLMVAGFCFSDGVINRRSKSKQEEGP